jgi:cytochrome c-type biogenesis protein CcmF
MGISDTLFTSNAIVTLDFINSELDKDSFNLSEDDIIIEALLKALDKNGDTAFAKPIYLIQSNNGYTIPDSIPNLGLKFEFNRVIPLSGKINISVSEKKGNKKEFIIMKALMFPFINLLWTGAILLIIGCALAIFNRVRSRLAKKQPEN